MSFEQFDKQTLTSSSHLTVSQNIELRILLNDCNRMSASGNLSGWRWKLDAIRRELYFDLVRLDKDIKDEKLQFISRLNEIEKDIISKFSNMPTNPKALAIFNRKVYLLLDKKEIILRELQEKSGKGTKRTYEDDEDDD